MQDHQLVTVDFHGQQLEATLHNGHPYVAMKPICENIGLSWAGQFERINRHPVLSEGIRVIRTPSSGGHQDMTCLPLSMLNGWLFGVDVNRVRPDVQPKLIRYQLECFDVLHRHFMQPSVPSDLYGRILKAEKDEAASRALASVAGRALSLRRKEKKVLGQIVELLREEVQLKLLLTKI